MKKYVITGIAVLLIALAVYFSSSLLSVIGEPTYSDTFDECRFVKPGNVCTEYTGCVYSTSLQASCIKGYEITGQQDDPQLKYDVYNIDGDSMSVVVKWIKNS